MATKQDNEEKNTPAGTPSSDKKIKAVEFLHTYPPYSLGEIAGFNVERAEELIADGHAKAASKRPRISTNK